MVCSTYSSALWDTKTDVFRVVQFLNLNNLGYSSVSLSSISAHFIDPIKYFLSVFAYSSVCNIQLIQKSPDFMFANEWNSLIVQCQERKTISVC